MTTMIDLIAKTASREELIELLRGTENQRQELERENATMREAMNRIMPIFTGKYLTQSDHDAVNAARDILSNI